MVVTQLPAGPTTHEVWLADESGSRVLYKRLINVYTEDGQTLEVAIEPQRNISEVLIHTIDSPSWVAWREVRVFGPRSAGLLEAEASAPEKRDTVTTELKRPESETSTSVGENVAPLGSGFASAEKNLPTLRLTMMQARSGIRNSCHRSGSQLLSTISTWSAR